MKLIILLSLTICATLAAPSANEDALQLLSLGNRQFAAAVYKEIQKSNKGSLIFSPFSAEVILALAAEGSKGDTRNELVSALRLPEDGNKIQQGFKELLPNLQINDESVTLASANKIYSKEDVKLEHNFEKIALDIYKSAIESINFGNNVEAADTINDWIEKQTNEKIKDIITPGDIDASTILVLINTLYLKAKWSKPFSNHSTNEQDFFKSATDVIKVPLMSQVSNFHFYENKELNAKFLQLPYRANGLSMVVILPNEKDGLTALEGSIEKLFELPSWTLAEVDVKLPKFTIDSTIPFADILKSLGVKKLFGGSADLTGISSTHKNLHVSDVRQKAFINVTESGTEAAAATVLVMKTYSLPMRLPIREVFHADHPFIYTINYNDVILFAGKYNP